jgi:unsaturated pyranuronate lyase
MTGRSGFFVLSGMPFKEKRDRVFIKSITGSKAQLTVVRLKPGTRTNHAHVNEQIGYVLAGKVRLEINGVSETLGPGDGYFIPSNAEHSFEVPLTDHLEYVELFCPPKQESITDFDAR